VAKFKNYNENKGLISNIKIRVYEVKLWN